MSHPVAAKGSWGTIEWAVDSRGRSLAREMYLELSAEERAKVDTLFKYLAELGTRFRHPEKFKNLGAQAGQAGGQLFELKSFQLRFLGDFRPGQKFIIAHGCRKKGDKLDRNDIERAVRMLQEDDARELGGN